ncbi:hypothetical protein RUMLAC_01074 [[Ruminococcus] lactaris ATCC 29176]|uniref:Uncharacterized protein n=1 Tax=[Ruminococcus] lactaris ATCC 29176 TaxID=471875 RepID=B5CNN4_9FIRM|nr:hypothetical protein RUMLAC_01074 [[Ruminococcus] lactaris ATCC 29176]
MRNNGKFQIHPFMNENTADGHIQIYYSICIWKVKELMNHHLHHHLQSSL